MKFIYKNIIILGIFLLLSGCSTISDSLDISSMINKAENWIFSEEENVDEAFKQLKIKSNY